jgi:hypothetical protein
MAKNGKAAERDKWAKIRDAQRADVDHRTEVAGYVVKDHGHRFFIKSLAYNVSTGEMYMPEGFKFVEYVGPDAANPGNMLAVLKDEIHG